MDWFNQAKTLTITITSAVFAFLKPITGDLLVMLMIFTANAFFGIIADIVDGKKWDKRKFAHAFVEALLFFVFVFIIYGIGVMKHNMDAALQCVAFVSNTVIYYYTTNIARNMRNILREGSLGHQVFSFIYWILSVEFIKKIPMLTQYLKTKQDEAHNS